MEKRNEEKVKAYKKKHYLKNRDKYITIERDRQYQKRYGITLADYNFMEDKQAGRCKICNSQTAGKAGQFFAVDHCHKTLRVRGLLCIRCNARLGWYEAYRDSINNYLEEKT